MFDPQTWAAVPFHFWSVVLFTFGCIVGSLLNVCIHRMPRGESVVFPSSHCPHCQYAIPWYSNLPLITWLYLRGQCANCGARISFRYFLVELLTGLAFLACWLSFGEKSALLALSYCLLLSGFIVASFIDFEHFIIPDQITIGGIVAGFLCSAAVPALHNVQTPAQALQRSLLGIAVGAGLIYLILRLGKMAFGRQKFQLESGTKVIFTETTLHVAGQDIPYGELLYRKTDKIMLKAKTVEMIDRCYFQVPIRLSQTKLQIGEETFDPEPILHWEAVTDQIVLPREAMGLGDVKFMAAIGAFLGWPAVLFTLMMSSVIGSVYGVTMIILKRQTWSGRLYFGPFIALAAVIWIFGGKQVAMWWLAR